MRKQKEQVTGIGNAGVNGKQKLPEEAVRKIGQLADGVLTATEIANEISVSICIIDSAKVKGVIRNLQKHGAQVCWKKASKNTVYAKVAGELK